MKLFKKLAAAALAAVLALSMVGCGAGGTGSALDLKNEVLNLIEDEYYLSGKTATLRPSAADATATPINAGCAPSLLLWPCAGSTGWWWNPAASLMWTSFLMCCGTTRWTAGITSAM